MPLFETSAKADEHQDHVNSIFMLIAHKLKHSKPLMSQPKPYAQRDISITTSSHTSANDTNYCMC
jgi:Ras-related protein Rab-33B